ncbi:general stress protein [Virgibacillus oceani]|uniref:General stress protein 17M-like domain-containing protein n=1 Tax=Virgibacillus oceani TaxID=1479511 RepID=A0A917M7U4_9BACI|nr:general stress protein [Virgibacillus oceani]GGG83245.1 hypothetical protein GCM10011398_31040 [Virgibacillus oceani]
MTNQIFGPYHSIEKAVAAVNILELKGYKASNITIFSSENKAVELDEQTDVNVEGESTNNESFRDKITSIFNKDITPDYNIHDKLMDYGLSNKQSEKYMERIESGEVLVIVDDELRMGNDATVKTVTMEVDAIHSD